MIPERLLHYKAFGRNIVVRVHLMPDSHIWFEWQVCKNGYCWWGDFEAARGWRIVGYLRSEARQELFPGDRYLVVNADPEAGPAPMTNAPVDATGLFRDFAALPLEEHAILAFANRHGMLTDGRLMVSGDEEGDNDDADFLGEPATVWILEINRMRFLNDFWQLVQRSDKRRLEPFIRWIDGPRGFRFDDGEGLFAPRDILGAPWLPRVLRERDLLFAAQFMLDTLVTEQLSGQIETALFRDSCGKPSLRFIPRDLRTALWLQFARAIEGNKGFQQCDHCRMWYEIGSREGARSDKKFCSTACRARHWRQTKASEKKSDGNSARKTQNPR